MLTLRLPAPQADNVRPKTALDTLPPFFPVEKNHARQRPTSSPATVQSTDRSAPVLCPETSTFPSQEPNIKPSDLGCNLQTQLEDHIENIIVPHLLAAEVEFCVTIVDFRNETVILVLVNDPIPVHLSSDFSGTPIKIGQGGPKIYTHQRFAHSVVAPRIAVPSIGASLGSQGSTGAGTLGMYVRDRTSGDVQILTALHIFATKTEPSTILVMSPAADDAAEVCAEVRSQLAEARQNYELSLAMNKRKVSQRLELLIDEYQSLLDIAEGDCRIGTVSKEVLIRDAREYIDAALVKVDEKRLLDCDPLALNDPTPSAGALSALHSRSRLRGYITPESIATDQPLEKVGRSSGYTNGLLNPVQIRGTMNTPYGAISNFLSWGVVPKQKDGSFTQPGDSGSIIYAGTKVVGMVFGGVNGVVDGYDVDITLFTPIERLQEVLGFELIQ